MEIDANLNLGPVNNPSQISARTKPEAVPPAENSFANTDSLLGALQNAPDVRPEAVAAGREAVQNDGYPPPDVVKKLANFLAKKLQDGAD
jgi:hypothetical protein